MEALTNWKNWILRQLHKEPTKINQLPSFIVYPECEECGYEFSPYNADKHRCIVQTIPYLNHEDSIGE